MKKVIWKGHNPTSGTYDHNGYEPLAKWDDLPSNSEDLKGSELPTPPKKQVRNKAYLRDTCC